MDVANVLHMNAGIGDASYANNSFLQEKVLLITKPITEKAIIDVYSTLSPKCVCIADLGCSSGQNTLLVVSELIKTIENTCKEMVNLPEYQIYLNDLPSNDFNSIFKSLPEFQTSLRKELGSGFGPCYFNGTPGSFYERLFPANSLHFVHSSYCLHWLSQVPNDVKINKDNICVTITSPPDVVKAYHEQFAHDFEMFLKFRGMGLVTEGRMVLTFLGRKDENPYSTDNNSVFELLGRVLKQMAFEGILLEDDVNSFNLPLYTPSPGEVKNVINKEGSFIIDSLEVSELHWSACDKDSYLSGGLKDSAYAVASTTRAVTEPMLISHFDEAIMDEVFRRHKEIVSDCMAKERTMFENITISLKKSK